MLAKDPGSMAARCDLFTSALLANRASDDSLRGVHVRDGETFEGDYALSNALHVKYPHVWQQDAHSALRASVIRQSRPPLRRRWRRLLENWTFGKRVEICAKSRWRSLT